MSASTRDLESDTAIDKKDSGVGASTTTIVINKNTTGDITFFGVGKQGTYMSFLVLVVGIVISIIMQRYAPSEIDLSAWQEGCPTGYEDSCKSNSAVLRISFALTILFAVQMLGSLVHSKFYDVFWVPKICVFICVVIGFYFAKSSVFGLHGYAWFARITGFFYLILQQIILLDMAYSWNERWVAYSTEDGEKGQRWLTGLLFFSAILFIGSFVLIGLMYWQFDGCNDNIVIISLTLILSVIATTIQVFFSDEGSILISAIMTAYATYVCYSSVSLNPNLSCNPTISTSYQTLSTVIGLVILVISMLWTTYNSIRTIPVDSSTGGTADLMSVATGGSAAKASVAAAGGPYSVPGMKSLFVQVSLVFLLISGFYAMVLTNWSTMQENDSQSDPRTGRVAMWIQAAGQWVAILVYLWSLVAPKIFPNRDFGA